MFKRIVVFGAATAIFASALLINLSILDLIAIEDLRETLGKSLSVIAVSTIAILLIIAIVKTGGKR